MTNESSPNDTRIVWQNQKPEGIRMSAEEIRRKAVRFERKVFWENTLNYLVGLVGVAFLSFLLAWHRFPTNVLFRLAFGWVVVALLYVLWQLHQRSPFRRVPAEMGIVSCLAFHRKELERRRDYHRRYWRLVLVPMIPVWPVLMVAFVQLHPRHLGLLLAAVNVSAVFILLTFWGQSRWAAHMLQHQIDELDAIQGQR